MAADLSTLEQSADLHCGEAGRASKGVVGVGADGPGLVCPCVESQPSAFHANTSPCHPWCCCPSSDHNHGSSVAPRLSGEEPQHSETGCTIPAESKVLSPSWCPYRPQPCLSCSSPPAGWTLGPTL